MKRPTSRRDSLELSALVLAANVVPGELVRPSVALAEAAVPPAADHIQPFPITHTTSAALEISGLTRAVASAAPAA